MFIVRRLILYFLPALFVFLSTYKFKVPFIGDQDIDSVIKIILFIIASVISYIIVPYYAESDKRRVKKLSASVKGLLNSVREQASNELAQYFIAKVGGAAKKDLKLNIRVFIPKHRSIFDVLYRRRFFVIKAYDGLCARDIEYLAFQVSPVGREQGLIGQVYAKKTLKYDFNLDQYHKRAVYKLDVNQFDATAYCSFSVASPVFKGISKKIIAIITFDSDVKVYYSKGQAWQDVVRRYCKMIYNIHKSVK